MIITAAQLRAARGLLDWTRSELAKASGLSPETIKNIEHGIYTPQEATIKAILDTFAQNDVEFTENEGVRKRDDIISIIEGQDCYLRLLHHIENAAKNPITGVENSTKEILFMYVKNELSPPEVVAADLRLRKLGCKFRSIIEKGDTYALYPLDEYRCIPSEYFSNEVHVIYGDRVATLINKREKVVILRNRNIADVMSKAFNFMWNACEKLTYTTAVKTYE